MPKKLVSAKKSFVCMGQGVTFTPGIVSLLEELHKNVIACILLSICRIWIAKVVYIHIPFRKSTAEALLKACS